MKNRITPKNITYLSADEVIVFGSNKDGLHGGGLAKICVEKFGAIHGQGYGLQGQSFAISTMEGVENIDTKTFIEFARENPDKIFLVTEIGTGIAGFKHEEIAPLFKDARGIENIHLPESFWTILNESTVVHGFKGMDKDMKCRGHQYEIGGEYSTDKEPIKCTENGYHFCENPLDIFSYYPGNSRFFKVEGRGKINRDKEDSKVAVSRIKIGIEINIKSIVEAGIKFMFNKITFSKENSTTGDRSGSQATGDRSGSQATGDRSGSQATGDRSGSQATGDRSMSSVNGDYSSSSITDIGEVRSKEAVAIGVGYQNKAKASCGNWLVLAERNDNYEILSVKTAKVDGKKIKADTWYKLVGGKFVKSE